MAKIFKHEGETYTPKQWSFAQHYADTLNGVQSARAAGYKGSYSVLGSTACENLKKPKIKTLVRSLLEKRLMPLEEILVRLEEQAKISIGEFVRVAEDGSTITIVPETVEELGHLIRKINVRRKEIQNDEKGYVADETFISIELHSSQRALELLGKYYKLFTDRVEHEGEVVLVKGYKGWSPDDWDEDED